MMRKFCAYAFGVWAISLISPLTPVHAQIPAFPGATGPGMVATGGRGGDVYHVTRLDADLAGALPGSFLYGAKNAPAAGRTIVFDVGGTIYLAGGTGNDDTLRFNWGNITVAGQTAPSPGITIAGTGTKWTGTDVVLRNIAVRPNKSSKPDTVFYDSFSMQLQSSIVDHVSATWFTDEGVSETDAGANSTIQYAIVGDGLNYKAHAFGAIVSTEHPTTEYSYNHNLFAELNTRIPAVGSEYLKDLGIYPVATTEFSNNVISNWGQTKAGYGSGDQAMEENRQFSKNNFINNYYINNKNPHPTTNLFRADSDHTMYASGNWYAESSAAGTITGANQITNSNSYFGGGTVFVNQPFAITGTGPETRETAQAALQRVTDYSGSNWQNRSEIDQHIVDKIGDLSANLINDLTGSPQAAQWTTLMNQRTATTRPANYDTDNDGMPDAWESAYGLSPTSASGANGNNGDFDSDGYTNVEEYINDLGAWPASSALVFTNALTNGRYAQIANWGNLWQPSRFDTAQIIAGAVAVDAVGQQAKILQVAPNSGNTAALSVTAGWLDVRQTLYVGVAGAGTVNQSGAIVRAATSVVIGGASVPSAYNLSGGTLSTALLSKGNAGSSFNFTGGVLHATTVAFSLANNGGTIAPGSDATNQAITAASMKDASGAVPTTPSLTGVTTIQGDLALNSGKLEIELASAASGQFDRVIVTGALTAGGVLDVNLLGSFVPVIGASFDILDFTSVTGAFTLDLPTLPVGRSWYAGNLLTTGDLSVVASADFNGDLMVDSQDFTIWQRGVGLTGQTTAANGDANGDGTVNSADLTVWTQQFGANPSSVSAAGSVPEPSALALLALAAPVFCRCRKRIPSSSAGGRPLGG